MGKPALNDTAAEMQTVVHCLQSLVTIFKILVRQIDIIEMMKLMDFPDFRDMLWLVSG